ncbi:MAG: aminotransferase class III-fold pyridoxal phosphate-dependent enzyme [Planctomycetes bacterium]|nr:aminotransferase class III-fold pyridoxal phosphate-dependent enzyme [Planctomycetota bacterium]
MARNWHAEFFETHLRSFVPPGSFDAHAHLYRREDAIDALPRHVEDESGRVGWASYCRALESWMGDRRPTDGLFFTVPKPTLDRPTANRFVAEEVRSRPGSRMLLMVHPADDPAEVEAAATSIPCVGLKVYHVYTDRPDTLHAPPEQFLPEWAWQLAHERDWILMLHLVRSRALADPVNQDYVRERCRRYPNARLILAHAARGFCGAHTVEGVQALRDQGNIYFDTSAICESQPLEAILRTFGPRRLLFGTDFPVSELRGRCVSIADGFLWLDEGNVDWQQSQFAQPTRVGIESLLALQQACRNLHLTDADVERIFCLNARDLLGIDRADRTDQIQAIYRRAKRRIPGGTQLLSKRPEMYAPDRWPAYFAEARGCEVIDLDGRRYCDLTTSGIGTCLLGYADPDVNAAVLRRIELGSMCTLNTPDELELADLLIQLHPWAEQVRFCRTGAESMAVAVRIARAHTGRDRVAFCGYHGWSDWYLAANLPERVTEACAPQEAVDRLMGHLLPGLAPAGVPRGLAGTALPFAYNRLDELERILEKHGRDLAAVVMEPTRSTDPDPGFLEGVRDLCRQNGAVLIFDEISAGWRLHLGGAHLRYGVVPDIAVFAKAISNGFPMGAILGRREVMDAAQRSFISSTYWTDGVGPAAALATIRKMQTVDVPAHVARIGDLFRDGLNELGRRYGVPLRVTGHPALLHIGFDHSDAAALGTLLTVRMLDRGFLTGSGFYPSLAHEEHHVQAYLDVAADVIAELADAIRRNDIHERLETPVRHSGFARLT